VKPLDRIERRLRRFAIPQLAVFLVAGQVVLYAIQWIDPAGLAKEF
jgi:hypothetical protein